MGNGAHRARRRQQRPRPAWPLFGAMLLLAGCLQGHENTGSFFSGSASGVWVGQIDSHRSDRSDAAIALVSPTGETHIFFPGQAGRQWSGELGFGSGPFFTSLRNYLAGGALGRHPLIGKATTAGLQFNGNLEARDLMEGNYAGLDDHGRYLLHYDGNTFEHGADVAFISAVWGFEGPEGYQVTLAIDALGLVFGSDTRGCQWQGRVTVPDAAVNSYQIELTLAICGDANGTYQGLVTTYSSQRQGDTLLMAVSNPQAAFACELARN